MAINSFSCVIAYAISITSTTRAFQPVHRQHQYATRVSRLRDSSEVEFQSLVVMDVVLFKRPTTTDKLELGAVQENGNVAPLSAWTSESAYTSETNDMLAFVAAEEDAVPGLSQVDVQVVRVLDEHLTGYGSRQVGGGKGPGNPHGEESELLYYVDRTVIEGGCASGKEGADAPGMAVSVVVDPGLEHLW